MFYFTGIEVAGERLGIKAEKREEDQTHLLFISFISQLLPSHACWCTPLPCSRAKRQVNFAASYPSWQRLWQQGGNSARCSQAAVGTHPTAKSLSKQFSVFSFPWVGCNTTHSLIQTKPTDQKLHRSPYFKGLSLGTESDLKNIDTLHDFNDKPYRYPFDGLVIPLLVIFLVHHLVQYSRALLNVSFVPSFVLGESGLG